MIRRESLYQDRDIEAVPIRRSSRAQASVVKDADIRKGHDRRANRRNVCYQPTGAPRAVEVTGSDRPVRMTSLVFADMIRAPQYSVGSSNPSTNLTTGTSVAGELSTKKKRKHRKFRTDHVVHRGCKPNGTNTPMLHMAPRTLLKMKDVTCCLCIPNRPRSAIFM